MAYKGVSIHNTGTNLGAGFGRRFGFVAYDGTDMRLENARDTVCACMSFL